MQASMHLFFFLFSLFFTAIHSSSSTTTTMITTNLSSCLVSHDIHNFSIPSSSSYSTLLDFSIQNLRFAVPSAPKPAAIILPSSLSELQNAIFCIRNDSLVIRVRSGGHSYEGLSYTAGYHNPFAVIDLMNLHQVRVDPDEPVAWVESGATLGEVYYAAAESNRSLAFSAGSCSTIGVGGHISGGGFGLLSRKYGLAADNVLDAVLIDSEGRVLNRASMGEDVFWALRGGGGGSWGVVYAWKLRLVPVPERVTMFVISRPGTSRFVAELVHKWQYVGPRLPDEFYLSTTVSGTLASFTGLFLGPKTEALSMMTQRFPELGLVDSDCVELSWVDSAAQFAGLDSAAELTDRVSKGKGFFKGKSDYVSTPISKLDLISIVDRIANGSASYIIMDPYGGAMGRIGSGEIAFPHRVGNLYGIQYMVDWTRAANNGAAEGYVARLRGFYDFMGPFVSQHPRAAYVNYVDLDLGTNNWTEGIGGSLEAVGHARVWGEKYFLQNYDRLVRAKSRIDPTNVFRNEQSIPPLA
ncbi:berberine bridge enzyme-like D-2 [Typha angustifolia]|uniref:berberine bridge enzyme-like D-2 n=1 Tax=Typha angustifolia TaxID=59011 RepID=UPI003C2D367E